MLQYQNMLDSHVVSSCSITMIIVLKAEIGPHGQSNLRDEKLIHSQSRPIMRLLPRKHSWDSYLGISSKIIENGDNSTSIICI